MDKLKFEKTYELLKTHPEYQFNNELSDVKFCNDERLNAPFDLKLIHTLKLFETEKLCCNDCRKCGEFISHKTLNPSFNLKKKVESFGLHRKFIDRQINRRLRMFPFITYKEERNRITRYNLFNCIDNVEGTDFEELINTTLCIYCIYERCRKFIEEAHQSKEKILDISFKFLEKTLYECRKIHIKDLEFTYDFLKLYPITD